MSVLGEGKMQNQEGKFGDGEMESTVASEFEDWANYGDDDIMQQQSAIRAAEAEKIPFVGDKAIINKLFSFLLLLFGCICFTFFFRLVWTISYGFFLKICYLFDLLPLFFFPVLLSFANLESYLLSF